MGNEDRIYHVAKIIADGLTEGNEQFDEMPESMRMRCNFAAGNILRHFRLEPIFHEKSEWAEYYAKAGE